MAVGSNHAKFGGRYHRTGGIGSYFAAVFGDALPSLLPWLAEYLLQYGKNVFMYKKAI